MKIKNNKIGFAKYRYIILLIFFLIYGKLSAQEDCLNFSDLTQSSVELISSNNGDEKLCSPADTDWFQVMEDTTAYDALTDYNLKIVPSGAEKAVRVGRINQSDQYITKSVSYSFDVDTSEFNTVLLRYAIVGTKTYQTFYTVSFAGEYYLTVPTCNEVIINNDDTWKISQDGTVFYRDWDTLFVPITDFKTQDGKLMVNMDAFLGDTAYAYFTVECVKLEFEIINDCKNTDSITFRAPDGFNGYNWHQYIKDEDLTKSKHVYYNEQEITVPIADGWIRCYVEQNVKRDDCLLPIPSRQGLVIPVDKILPTADYQYKTDTCKSIINLTSVSYGKSVLTGEIDYNYIDSVQWICDNGKVYYGKEFDLRVDENREYTVKLVAYLKGYNCSDTLEIKFNIDFNLDVTLEGKDTICEGESLTLLAQCGLSDADYTWNTGSKEKSITVTPTLQDSVYYVTVRVGEELCSTKYKDIKVVPTTYDTLILDICEGEIFTFDGIDYTESGFYEHKYTTAFGCDSILTLDLRVYETYNDTLFVQYCDTGYYDNNFTADSSGFYTQNLQSQYGCDSIVNLDFTRWDVFSDTIKYQIYKGQTYRDDNFEESEGGTYEKVFTDINGCDSVYVLDLEVLQLKFPNTITANGDGINDVFEIYGLLEQTMFEEITLKVYNRYGRQIFEQKKFESKEDFWDPAANNTPTGTYFYRFIAKGKQKNLELTGVIEVFR